MVSTTSITTPTIATFGTCFNNAPIKAATVTIPSVALAAAMQPSTPPGPSPPPPTLENVTLFGENPRTIAELIALGNASAAKTTGSATPAFTDEESFKRDVEYFKALLAARAEQVEKYRAKLTALRSLRAKNTAIRKRNNLKARRMQKKNAAARSAGTEAGAVATDSEGSTLITESMATSTQVGGGVVGGVWHGNGDCHDSIQGGICASPVSMDEDRADKYAEMGMYKDSMYYSA